MRPLTPLMAPGADAGRTPPAVLTAHVAANAARYFPELAGGPVEVRSSGGSVRPASVLYSFDVQIGGDRRSVLAKIPLVRTGIRGEVPPTPEPPDRPRLVQPAPTETKFLLEFAALTAIHEHFQRLDDARFGAVRTLDLLPEHRALIMESVQGRSLRKLFYSLYRGQDRAADSSMEGAFRNAGAWLRAYHALAPQEPAELRHTRRADYVRFIAEVAEFLGDHLGDLGFFQWVTSALMAAAKRVLPDRLPLGLGHGDFALRNILVGPQSRITVLDTLGRYRAPIYEDIGYFLVSLRYNWPQVLSLGTAFPSERVARYEIAFLSGYFDGEAVPYGAVRLYELQAMLDRWSVVAWRRAHAVGQWARSTELVKLALLSHLLRRRVVKDVTELLGATAEERRSSEQTLAPPAPP